MIAKTKYQNDIMQRSLWR